MMYLMLLDAEDKPIVAVNSRNKAETPAAEKLLETLAALLPNTKQAVGTLLSSVAFAARTIYCYPHADGSLAVIRYPAPYHCCARP